MASSTISARELESELKRLIDALIKPWDQVKHPKEYWQAELALKIMLSDRDLYKSLFRIKPECESNRIIPGLGKARIQWLQEFYEREFEPLEEVTNV